MPKLSINYSNTIIYKIVCKNVEIKECYVGQTTSFNKRKSHHKNRCDNINIEGSNCYVYQFMRDNGGWNNWSMIEIEKYNALDRLDAHKRERYWIETLQSKLNSSIPTRTHKEFYEQNKEEALEKAKIYRDNHKEQTQKYRDEHKNEKKNWYEQNKERLHLKYKTNYEANREENKLKYEQNKDKINAQRRLRKALKKEAQA